MAESCKGCKAVHKELWPKGKAAYRCMHLKAGQHRGYVIEVTREEFVPSLIRPAWCPRNKKEGANA